MKTPIRLAAVLAVIAAAGAFAGCRNSTNTVDSATPRGTPSPEAMNHTITDPSLSDAVVPVFYNRGKTPGGIVVVQLQVQNQTRTDTRVNYVVEWKDANGMMITTPEPVWKPLVIPPGKIQTIQEVAPSSAAVDASISFRESKNN